MRSRRRHVASTIDSSKSAASHTSGLCRGAWSTSGGSGGSTSASSSMIDPRWGAQGNRKSHMRGWQRPGCSSPPSRFVELLVRRPLHREHGILQPVRGAGARARARASRGFSPIRRAALPVLYFDPRDAPRPGAEHAALVAKLRAALSPGNDASATTAAVDAMIPGGDALSPWLAAFEDAVSNASCHRAAAFASRPSACLFVTSKARRDRLRGLASARHRDGARRRARRVLGTFASRPDWGFMVHGAAWGARSMRRAVAESAPTTARAGRRALSRLCPIGAPRNARRYACLHGLGTGVLLAAELAPAQQARDRGTPPRNHRAPRARDVRRAGRRGRPDVLAAGGASRSIVAAARDGRRPV